MIVDNTRQHVLITGGAGFIGSHLADVLVMAGHRVRVLDNLSVQVHGERRQRPSYLNDIVELMVGDVRDPRAVRAALNGIDCVFHLAAAVGVGQSMYQIADYTSVNSLGTAVLLEALTRRGGTVRRLIVASSMSIYGEGLYRDRDGEIVTDAARTIEQLRHSRWEPQDERGYDLQPIPTPERKPASLASVYALNKFDQEQLCMITGRAYGVGTVALRLFNVFGTRQALSNPYTGVLAIFLSRLMNDKPPLVYEDGQQLRDFVSVHDVAHAFHLAMTSDEAPGEVFNIGSGRQYSVLEIARRAARVLGKSGIEPEITGKYRVGDIRHCFADISHARAKLGYQPRVALEDGLCELANWLEDKVAIDRVEEAHRELASRGLAV